MQSLQRAWGRVGGGGEPGQGGVPPFAALGSWHRLCTGLFPRVLVCLLGSTQSIHPASSSAGGARGLLEPAAGPSRTLLVRPFGSPPLREGSCNACCGHGAGWAGPGSLGGGQLLQLCCMGGELVQAVRWPLPKRGTDGAARSVHLPAAQQAARGHGLLEPAASPPPYFAWQRLGKAFASQSLRAIAKGAQFDPESRQRPFLLLSALQCS